MQSLAVQTATSPNPPPIASNGGNDEKKVENGKTGAETARNGSSFLAMIEKMIAGTKDGKAETVRTVALKTAGRGAGDGQIVPGDEHTLIKSGPDKAAKSARQGKNAHDSLARTLKGSKSLDEKERTTPETDRTAMPLSVEAALAQRLLADGAEGPVTDQGKLAEVEMTEQQGLDRQSTDLFSAHSAAGLPGIGSKSTVAGASKQPEETVEDKSIPKARGADRKEKKSLISVRDERHDLNPSNDHSGPLVKSVDIQNDGSADMTIGFRADGSSSSADLSPRMIEARSDQKGQSFAAMLSSELRDNAADFVKTGSIVLRENNAGLIRLTLHPESLGNVKISLEMSSDRKITGKIVVSSKEAYDAFNENLDGLSAAFVDGGFQSAGFDLSWNGQDGSGYGKGEETGTVSSPFYASSIPDVMSGRHSADSINGIYGGLSAINVFA